MERNGYNRPWSQSKRNTVTFVLHFVGCLTLLAMLSHSTADLQNETLILLNMKAGWRNPPELSSWSRNVHTCSWHSISCDAGNTTVTSLTLIYTNLNAPLPDTIGDLRNLKYLDMNNSGLTGHIPSSIGRLKNLMHLNFQENNLIGQIPTELSNLTKLTYLKFSYNHLSGPIPSLIGSVRSLMLIRLDNNALTGEIPNDFSNLTNLEDLFLKANQLSGPIPGGIDQLHSLKDLYLSENSLTGGISLVFSNFTRLINLDFSQNMLSGPIPDSIDRCQNLQHLYMNNNNLTGPIPTGIGNISMMQKLDFSQNKLSGPIPIGIFEFQGLLVLKLFSNFLIGPIPDTFNQLANLQVLSLNDNCLSGKRPTENVSYNLDVGGNCFNGDSTCKCVCGLDCMPYHNEDGNEDKSIAKVSGGSNHAISDIAKHVYIAVGVTAGTLLMVTSLLVICRHKSKIALTDGNNYVVKKYTLNEVKDATNNFTTNLGEGAFAIVYHAKFQDGTQAAVKHFKQRHTTDTLKDFEKEVELLAKIHHRFLVNLIGYCTDQGHHMLLFEFMNKGNLKEILHGNQNSPGLTWEERVRIMISVGHGLEYLHFGRSPPLIHRDIKSANILLSSTTLNSSSILVDQDNVCPKDTTLIAKIADFGLGRETLLDDDKVIQAYGHEYPKPVHTKVAGTPGYIDPEYFRTSVLSSAVDVYSFGVVLLELITGKPALSAPLSGDESWAPLAERVPPLEEEELLGIIDPCLEEGGYDKEQLLAVVEQARLCVQSRAQLRPSMRDIVGVFTDLFHVETKLVYPSLHLDHGSLYSSDASKSSSDRLQREFKHILNAENTSSPFTEQSI